MTGRIVVMSGVGSIGKTVVAREAQAQACAVARRDRIIGLARAQVDWMNRGVDHDLMVDCGAMVPAEMARLICKEFDL